MDSQDTETQQSERSENPVEENQRAPTKTLFKNRFSLIKMETGLALITSVVIRIAVILCFTLLSIYLYKEFTDKSYHIQEFQVPQHYLEMGYTGNVLARRLEFRINEYIGMANRTWSEKEIEEYNQSADRTQVQVEVAGVGFSPQSVVKSVKHLFGVPTKEIAGEVVSDGAKLFLMLKITGKHAENLVQEIGKRGETEAMEMLIKTGAKKILEINNPLILGIFYAGQVTKADEPHGDSLGIQMFRSTVGEKPRQAATAYAWWARSILNSTGDTLAAVAKVKKALLIDPENAFAYRIWAGIKFQNKNFVQGEKLMLKSLSIDPTSASSWVALAETYSGQNGERDNDAIECYKKAIALEPENAYQFELAELYLYKGWYSEALDLIEAKENVGWEFANPVKFIALEALSDSIEAKKELERITKEDNGSNGLNHGANMFLKRKKLDVALRLARLSIKADSTNKWPYTTLAELSGLTGNDEGFYLNLEKAIRLGFDMKEINDTNDEPYNRYANQERYKLLKANHASINSK